MDERKEIRGGKLRLIARKKRFSLSVIIISIALIDKAFRNGYEISYPLLDRLDGLHILCSVLLFSEKTALLTCLTLSALPNHASLHREQIILNRKYAH